MINGEIQIGVADNGLILELPRENVLGYFDAGRHELHLYGLAMPVHACTSYEAAQVAGVHALTFNKTLPRPGVPVGVIFH